MIDKLDLSKYAQGVFDEKTATMTLYDDDVPEKIGGWRLLLGPDEYGYNGWWNGEDMEVEYVEELGVRHLVFAPSFFKYKPDSMRNWFSGWKDLEDITGLEHVDTSQVEDMFNLFSECRNLVSIDLSSWDTNKVSDMDGMFFGCASLQSVDMSAFTTESLQTADEMFCGCTSLRRIDMGRFDAKMYFTYPKRLFRLENMSFVKENSQRFVDFEVRGAQVAHSRFKQGYVWMTDCSEKGEFHHVYVKTKGMFKDVPEDAVIVLPSGECRQLKEPYGITYDGNGHYEPTGPSAYTDGFTPSISPEDGGFDVDELQQLVKVWYKVPEWSEEYTVLVGLDRVRDDLAKLIGNALESLEDVKSMVQSLVEQGRFQSSVGIFLSRTDRYIAFANITQGDYGAVDQIDYWLNDEQFSDVMIQVAKTLMKQNPHQEDEMRALFAELLVYVGNQWDISYEMEEWLVP